MLTGPLALCASVTPFDEKGRIDLAALAKQLAWLEACGVDGAVLAGTTGEGPSLSAPEKRDLIQGAQPLKGTLKLILGISTPSLDEAIWLCKQAGIAQADAVLLGPPYYYRSAGPDRVVEWLRTVLDASPVPAILYNIPQMTGVPLTADMVRKLGQHANCLGVKDSSGDASNLPTYRAALAEGKVLLVGDETLLGPSLAEGWTGTISGAANTIGRWLREVIHEWSRDREAAEAKFQICLPTIQTLRSIPQPAMSKAILHRLGVLPSNRMRLPLEPPSEGSLQQILESVEARLGSLLAQAG